MRKRGENKSKLEKYVETLSESYDRFNENVLKKVNFRKPKDYGDNRAIAAIIDRHEAVREELVYAAFLLQRNFSDTLFRIANVGCGPEATVFLSKRLSEEFPDKEFKFLGIDISKATIQSAKDLTHEEGLKNIQYQLFNMFNLINKDSSVSYKEMQLYPWHCAVLEGVNHNYDDSVAVSMLKAIKCCLHEDGLLVLGETAAKEGYSWIMRMISKYFTRKMYGPGVKFIYRDRDEVEDLIKEAGFNIVHYRPSKLNHIFTLRLTLDD